jgi:hypothetical protein
MEKYGQDSVIVFDKKAIAATFDQADNFDDMRAIVYARNASFQIAKDLGLRYFLQLDDDYMQFRWNHTESNFKRVDIQNLDTVFELFLDYMESAHQISSIAFAQGGDFIGGALNPFSQGIWTKRKCMNSFFCSTERPFQFTGRINEDVNTYTRQASTGKLFLTTNQVSLTQKETQSNPGGMTDIYLDQGTYIKSFYTVMHQPSSVYISVLTGPSRKRIHHRVDWERTVPKILRESLRATS